MTTIVLITTSYPDNVPGADAAGSFVEDFAIALSEKVRVVVVAASHESSLEERNQLTVHRFAVPSLPLSLLNPVNPFKWPAIFRTLRAGRHALDAMLESESVDHVIALWVLPSGWWALKAATARNIGFSTWALGSDIWTLSKVPLVRRIVIGVLRSAKFRFADGLELSAEVESLSGLPCSFLPSSRQLQVKRPVAVASQPPYKLAFLGRWHPNKGIDLLMEALAKMGDDDWAKIEEVRIFGGGPLENEVRANGQALVAAGRPVTIGGFLDRSAAAELICWADYQVIPSRLESVPVIYSDAMQCGTPVISTPVGDLPTLIGRHGSGLLAAAAEAPAIAASIREALDATASDYRTNLDAAAEEFDLSKATGRLLDLLELRD